MNIEVEKTIKIRISIGETALLLTEAEAIRLRDQLIAAFPLPGINVPSIFAEPGNPALGKWTTTSTPCDDPYLSTDPTTDEGESMTKEEFAAILDRMDPADDSPF